jgi:hypothetical protein
MISTIDRRFPNVVGRRQIGHFILGAMLSILATQSTVAAPPSPVPGLPPAQAPVFCLTNEHVYQLLLRTPFARLWNMFQMRLGLVGRIRGSELIFRGGIRNAETITYAIERHEGGIALLNMRVRLHNLSEDRTGTDMCLRTFVIINGGPRVIP